MGKGSAGACIRAFMAGLATAAVTNGLTVKSAVQSLSECTTQKIAEAGGNAVNKIGSTLRPGRRKFNEIPRGITHDGREVVGEFGARLKRETGDYVQINQSISRIRQETTVQRKNIYETAGGLSGNNRLEYLDRTAQDLDGDLLFLREQYDLYGANSVQGRVIDQKIKSNVHLLNEVERLAGYRDSDYYGGNVKTNRSKPGDFGYIPEGGEFGRRVGVGQMGGAEKGAMQQYRDTWKVNRSDAYDSIKSGFQSEMDRDYQTFSQKIEHNAAQREIYRGTDWKRTLDYEILRDLKVMKALNEKDPQRYKLNSAWNSYLPPYLRDQL